MTRKNVKKTCRTCEYALAPNNAGCICSWGYNTEFHAGIEPCNHYKLANWLKGAVRK